MNTGNTETLDWQSIVSNWTFTCGGEAPPEGLAASVIPTVSRSSDGLFEITAISFGFSGTAPNYQQKFTANFSFSVSSPANFYEIAVSSDDTATVRLGGNDFVSSRLNTGGIASSPWHETATNLPEVSGTFETVGGPYSLSVTITLKRLVGAEWRISETWTEAGPYEIKTATLSFSGSARSGTLGFSWIGSVCNIAGGNWVDISVEADDEATVTVGEHSATAKLNAPVVYNSTWTKDASGVFPLSVIYRNVGGPYRLSVTVTVKRSLRRLHLGYWFIPPTENSSGAQNEDYPISNRRKIGVGEDICVYSVSKKNQTEPLGELESIVIKSAQGSETVSCEDGGASVALGGFHFVNEGNTDIVVKFTDGEILEESLTIVFPAVEEGEEISRKEYLLKEDGTVFLDEELNSTDPSIQSAVETARQKRPGEIRRYRVRITSPENVSFSGICYWECTGTYEVSGVFADTAYFPEGWRIHHPTVSPNSIMPEFNHWIDDAGMSLNKLPENYENVPEGACLGTLIWRIPVRWDVYETETDRVNAAMISNDMRSYKGEFAFKAVQTMTCVRTAAGIKVVVDKKYS